MTMKYYRPNQRRRTVIVPTKRFYIIIGIAAAIVVAIVLLVTLSSDSSGETADTADGAQTQNSVPALEQSQGVPSVVTDDGSDTAEQPDTAPDDASQPETEGTASEPGDTVTPQPADSAAEYKQLGLESEGDDVKKLQEKLIELGYLDAKATGYYGTVTYDAVRDFQNENGLEADGIAGAQTQAVLFSGSAKAAG